MIRSRLSLPVIIIAATVVPGGRADDLATPPRALRVVASGNSFANGSVSTFDELTRLAGIKVDHKLVYSGIGGSRVIQHWDLPDSGNVAKRARYSKATSMR